MEILLELAACCTCESYFSSEDWNFSLIYKTVILHMLGVYLQYMFQVWFMEGATTSTAFLSRGLAENRCGVDDTVVVEGRIAGELVWCRCCSGGTWKDRWGIGVL